MTGTRPREGDKLNPIVAFLTGEGTDCAGRDVFEVISFAENDMVPWVSFHVVDPVRTSQLLHERVEAPQAIYNARLEPHFSGAGPLVEKIIRRSAKILEVVQRLR